VDHRQIELIYGLLPEMSCEILRIPLLVDLIAGMTLNDNLDFRRRDFEMKELLT
jgi:hypothetical protein